MLGRPEPCSGKTVDLAYLSLEQESTLTPLHLPVQKGAETCSWLMGYSYFRTIFDPNPRSDDTGCKKGVFSAGIGKVLVKGAEPLENLPSESTITGAQGTGMAIGGHRPDLLKSDGTPCRKPEGRYGIAKTS